VFSFSRFAIYEERSGEMSDIATRSVIRVACMCDNFKFIGHHHFFVQVTLKCPPDLYFSGSARFSRCVTINK
jgi:hypothetical protein